MEKPVTHRRLCVNVLALAVIAMRVTPTVAGVEAGQFPSNEDLRHYRAMDDPKLSPDGRMVLLQIKDSTADGGRGHLWLIDIRGGEPRQLTYSPDSDKEGESEGQWMPDGRSIAFIAHRGEHTTLFHMPMNGGEAQAFDIKVPPVADGSTGPGAPPPTEIPVDVDAYQISPDGKWIAIAARDPETPGEKRLKEAKRDALWVDHDPHGTRLYLLQLATGRVTAVPVPPNVKEVVWSEDAARLVAVCSAANDYDEAGEFGLGRSTWLVKMDDLQRPEKVAELPTSIRSVTWSAKSLYFKAQAQRDAPPYYPDLYAYDLDAKTTANLSDGYDGSIQTLGQAPIALARGGVLQVVEKGLELSVATWSASGGTPPNLLRLPFAAIARVATNAARNGWLFLGSSSGHAPVLLYAAKLTDVPRALPIPALAPAYMKSAVAKRIQWNNEGLTVDGLLYLPPEASAQNPMPLIVETNGVVDEYDPFVDFLVGRGFAVMRSNPRGNSGRGPAFAAVIKNDLGGGDYRDIMAGVDFVLKTAPIDPARLALVGYSYGGEMAGFVEGKTTRFKAIVSGDPVIDQFSEYGTQAFYSSSADRWFYGKPWEHVADVWRQSPLSGVGTAKTPFLLLQGQSDEDDPPGQSYEMYRALRQMGVPVELVTYPREDHWHMGLALYGYPSHEPWHGFDARERMLNFIERALRPAHDK